MRTLKLGLLALGALVLIAVGIVAILVARFDPNKYKPDIVKLVQDKYDRVLTIEGDIGVRIRPKLGANLGRTTLSEPGSAKSFAKVERAQVSLALWPLLSKRIVVDRVELVGLSVELIRHKDGSTNFDDLTGGKAKTMKPASPPTQSSGSSPVEIDIAGVQIKDASIGWRDDSKGTQVRLSKLALTTGRIADDVPGKLDLTTRIDSVQPKLALDLALVSGYRLRLDGSAYAFDGLDLTLQGDAPGVSGLSATAKGDVALEDRGGRINVSGLRVEASAKEGLTLKVSAPKLQLTPEKSVSAAVTADIKLNRPGQSIDAKIALAAVEGRGQIVQFSNFGIDLAMKHGEQAMQGKIDSPLRVDLKASELQLTGITGEVTISGPTIPNRSMKVALGGNAHADWAKQNAHAELVAKFDESNARLKAMVHHFDAPQINFDLAVDRLNMDRYLPPKKPVTGAGAGAGGGDKAGSSLVADNPIDLSGLKSLTGSGSVAIGSLVAAAIKLDNLKLNAKAAGGRVDLAPISANIYQGTLAGTVAINANANQITIRQQLTNVAVGPLLRDAADKDLLEGRGTVVLDIATGGATVSALKRALAGSATVNLRDAQIKGINLAEMFRKAQALAGGGGVQEMSAVKTEKTDFSELSASFAVRNGVAHNDDLNGKSPFLRLTGAGDIDIAAGTMNYTAKAQSIGSVVGQGGRDQEARRGVTIPLRVSGALDNLKYQVDFQSLAVDAVKDEAKKRLDEEIRKRLGDDPRGRAAGELLKGLLGR